LIYFYFYGICERFLGFGRNSEGARKCAARWNAKDGVITRQLTNKLFGEKRADILPKIGIVLVKRVLDFCRVEINGSIPYN